MKYPGQILGRTYGEARVRIHGEASGRIVRENGYKFSCRILGEIT